MIHELHALLGEPKIAQTARIGRLRWAGHVARMDVDSPVRLLFDREDGGKGRKRGAQRTRSLDHWRKAPKTEEDGGIFLLQHQHAVLPTDW